MVDKLLFREESMVLRCFSKILPMLCPILIGPLFYQGFHTKDGLDFLLAHGYKPVRPTRLVPSGIAFCFYPLQYSNLRFNMWFKSFFFFFFGKLMFEYCTMIGGVM